MRAILARSWPQQQDHPRRLDVSGFPIGMIDGAEYDESVVDLQPGDRLYLHSDGLTEEVNDQDEQFGDERLLSAIAEGQALSLNDSVDLMVQKVVAWRRRRSPAG